MRYPLRCATAIVLLLTVINFSFAQRRSKTALVCKQPVLAALKPIPALSYLDSRSASEPLKVIQGQTLARSFIIYVDDANGKIDDNGRTLSRKVLRWNGRVFR